MQKFTFWPHSAFTYVVCISQQRANFALCKTCNFAFSIAQGLKFSRLKFQVWKVWPCGSVNTEFQLAYCLHHQSQSVQEYVGPWFWIT